MDLGHMNIEELRRLIKDANAEIDRRRKMDKKKTLQEIKKLAQDRGYDLDELLSSHGMRKNGGGREKSVRYRHPEDPNKTWTGMGRKPAWLKEWLDSGHTLEELGRQ